jgi:tetratricopeptide (TPR) repeat protein
MDYLEKLTILVATYGVYAILVLYLFVVLKRATDTAFRKGTPAERRYFRWVHAATLAFTMVLTVGVCAVWVKVNVLDEPMIWGMTSDLREQLREPRGPGDPAQVEPVLQPLGAIDGFYTSASVDSVTHKVTLKWLVRPARHPKELRFRLLVKYAVWNPDAAHADPTGASGNVPLLSSGHPAAEFTLPLAAQGHQSTDPIQLVYTENPAGSDTMLGQMLLRHEGRDDTPIPWKTSGAAPPAVKTGPGPGQALLRYLVQPLLAQARGDSVRFGADGSYDSLQGDLLRRRLGGRDLRQQVDARDAIVQQGSRALRFITESADVGRSRTVDDPALLVHNLADALSRIRPQDRQAHEDAWLTLALASYRLGDYGSAAAAFQRADATLAGQPASTLYYRGFSFYQIGRHRDALNDFRSFARFAATNAERTAAHGMMGLQYARLGKGDSAIAEYRRALTWGPSDDITRNNLAYQLAEQRRQLNEALTLINRVLAHNPNVGSYLDTKAWVLYRMRRLPQALALVDSAAALAPDNATIREHRRLIHAALPKP